MELVKLLHDLLVLVLFLAAAAIGITIAAMITMARERRRRQRLEELIEKQAMEGLEKRDNRKDTERGESLRNGEEYTRTIRRHNC